VRLGTDRAMTIILCALGAAVVLSLVVFALSPLDLGAFYRIAALAVGVWLLLYPAVGLHRTRAREQVMGLFNRASYYPIALFFVVLIKLFLR
jgi:heme O synthase-like polyprenyltransferase